MMPDRSNPSPDADVQPIRDQLAIDRTILANERTMLAYVRTALAVLIVSLALIAVIDSIVTVIIGIILMPASIAIVIAGVRRYRRRRETITRLFGQTPMTLPGIPPPSKRRPEPADEPGEAPR